MNSMQTDIDKPENAPLTRRALLPERHQMKHDGRNRLRVKRAGRVVVETADRRTVAGLMRDISMDGLYMHETRISIFQRSIRYRVICFSA